MPSVSDPIPASWRHFVAPVVVGLVVGLGSGLGTAYFRISGLDARITALEKDIVRLQARSDARLEGNADLRQRMTRVETKIDILLNRQGISPSDVED